MGWQGHLSLDYRVQQGRTVALDRHSGPLRVLRRLYPEGDAICHHVLVHPPGGLVGGDELRLDVQLDSGAHALITTPGATRYYRSEGLAATQRVHLQLATGTRLEWLPLETLAHPGCEGANQVTLDLQPGAEMIGWDLLALGLPASEAPFDHGCFTQRLQWPGVWLERARIDARDRLLLDSPMGLAGHRVLGTLWWASGSALTRERRQRLMDGAREQLAASPLAATAGCTSPDDRLVLMRVLAHRVEPAMALLQAVRAAWRSLQWGLQAQAPRLWRT
jgi:urease accessory protein